MKKFFTVALILMQSLTSFSQSQGDGGVMNSAKWNLSWDNVAIIKFERPDIKKLKEEDLVNDVKGSGPWRFGYNHETSITLDNAGVWTTLSNGGALWRLGIASDRAQSINLTLKNSFIPKGNELFVTNLDHSITLGAFTQNHLYKGELGVELLKGSTVFVEYYVAPENSMNIGAIEIVTVTHGYRTFEEFGAKAFGQSGACHMNVNCPDGAPYADQKRGVVMIVSGSNGICSGSLINNTAQDGKPYVLTANHCYNANLANWIFRFNWESANCTNPSSSPAFSSLSGSQLRARRVASDFLLVEITGGLEGGTVPSSYNAYFSGWDRSGVNPSSTFGIHHPRGDIKKISFDDHPSMPSQSVISGVTSDPNAVWQVVWDRGTTTESVSSGSPLFDQNKRIIGQLWGGGASCSDLDARDYYGRIFSSWEPAGSDQTNQLKHWLDPSSTGAYILDGLQFGNDIALDGALMSSENVTQLVCSEDFEAKFYLVNMGETTLTSAKIKYGINNLEQEVYDWTGSLATFERELITLPNINVDASLTTFSARIELVNGVTDPVTNNNRFSTSLRAMDDPKNYTFSINLDCYPAETEWWIEDLNGQKVIKNDLYNFNDSGLKTYTICLDDGCYKLVVTDDYGDGMTGCAAGNGSFKFVNSNNTVLVDIVGSAANFGARFEKILCVGPLSVNEVADQVTIHPNPSSGSVYFDASDLASVAVVDLHGKVIQSVLLEGFNATYELKVDAALEGVYFLHFITLDGQLSQQKVIFTR